MNKKYIKIINYMSVIALLLLYLTPTLLGLMIIIMAAILYGLFVKMKWLKIFTPGTGKINVCSCMGTVAIMLNASITFYETWYPSSKFQQLMSVLNISPDIALIFIDLLISAAALWGAYEIINLLYIWLIQAICPDSSKSNITSSLTRKNYRYNWYFILSLSAFFLLNSYLDIKYISGFIIAIALIVGLIEREPAWSNKIPQSSNGLKLFCLSSAIGVSWFLKETFYNNLYEKFYGVDLALVHNKSLIIDIIGTGLAIISVFFIVQMLIIFWKCLKKIIRKCNLLGSSNYSEMVIYILVSMFIITSMILIYTKTNAFYGSNVKYDVIYTSDSAYLFHTNAYLDLISQENDIRQPLFAVFSAPFLAVPYLLGKLMNSEVLQAIFMNAVQIMMLIASGYFLASAMHLNKGQRISFILIFSSSFVVILFSLMMEQYIIAIFWLSLLIAAICSKIDSSKKIWVAATGTLLTSGVLLSFIVTKEKNEKLESWVGKVVNQILAFLAVIVAAGRIDIIFNLVSKIHALSRFAGRTAVTLAEKIFQFTNMVASCFIAPASGVFPTEYSPFSWQLEPVKSINSFGLIILILSFVGLWCCRKKLICKIAGFWILFSLFMTLILGWGTKENGLILYALYFGWPYFVLLFQLLCWAADKIHFSPLVPVVAILAVFAMAIYNYPRIVEMVSFAIQYYPA